MNTSCHSSSLLHISILILDLSSSLGLWKITLLWHLAANILLGLSSWARERYLLLGVLVSRLKVLLGVLGVLVGLVVDDFGIAVLDCGGGVWAGLALLGGWSCGFL